MRGTVEQSREVQAEMSQRQRLPSKPALRALVLPSTKPTAETVLLPCASRGHARPVR